MNARDVITQALKLIRVVPAGEDPTADDANDAETALNMLLKTWGANRHLWITTYGTITLVADQVEYSVPDARRVNDMQRRYLTNNIDTPMIEMSRWDYDQQPNKFNASIPTMWYFNPQRDTRTVYLWPPPTAATAAAYSIRYTYQRVLDDIDSLNNDNDVPQEWLETLTYNLADRLMDYHNVDFPKITARAQALYAALAAQDQESVSVFLQPNFQY